MLRPLFLRLTRFVAPAFAGLALLAGATGCASFRSFERGVSQYVVSPAQETQLGATFSQEIQKEYQVIDTDATVQPWLERMGYALAQYSPETSQEFRFALVNDPAINAFAIPGGFCYVNTGLLLYAENEAQVAAVVGHEINHVTMRHGITRMQRQMGVGAMASLMSGEAASSQIAAQVVQTTGGAVVQRYGQEDELEADALGAEAMYYSGYDPRQAVEFFRRLEAVNPSSSSKIAQFLSTHPATTTRIEQLEAQVAAYDLESADLVVNTPEFLRVQEHVRATYGAEGAASLRSGAASRLSASAASDVDPNWLAWKRAAAENCALCRTLAQANLTAGDGHHE